MTLKGKVDPNVEKVLLVKALEEREIILSMEWTNFRRHKKKLTRERLISRVSFFSLILLLRLFWLVESI